MGAHENYILCGIESVDIEMTSDITQYENHWKRMKLTDSCSILTHQMHDCAK